MRMTFNVSHCYIIASRRPKTSNSSNFIVHMICVLESAKYIEFKKKIINKWIVISTIIQYDHKRSKKNIERITNHVKKQRNTDLWYLNIFLFLI